MFVSKTPIRSRVFCFLWPLDVHRFQQITLPDYRIGATRFNCIFLDQSASPCKDKFGQAKRPLKLAP